jgi:hypothetical protein
VRARLELDRRGNAKNLSDGLVRGILTVPDWRLWKMPRTVTSRPRVMVKGKVPEFLCLFDLFGRFSLVSGLLVLPSRPYFRVCVSEPVFLSTEISRKHFGSNLSRPLPNPPVLIDARQRDSQMHLRPRTLRQVPRCAVGRRIRPGE